jgi:hypothetical protein
MPRVQDVVPPFRAGHVGSLMRPPELLRAREQHQAGTSPPGAPWRMRPFVMSH